MSEVIDAVHRDRIRDWIRKQREARTSVYGAYEMGYRDALSDLQSWLDGTS